MIKFSAANAIAEYQHRMYRNVLKSMSHHFVQESSLNQMLSTKLK